MKKGLILEGGAMRGMFSAGVIDVLMENDIYLDGCVGTSAGAVFGCNYKSKQIGRVLRYNMKYCQDSRYVGIRNLLKTGDLYSRDFAYHEVPLKLDPFDQDNFTNSPMEFYACCTDLETGKALYHKCEKGDVIDIEWMRASASMPVVSKIVELDGHKLLDGGMSDSIPLKFFESIGYHKNIVVLTQPQDYLKKPNKIMPIIKIALHNYPKAIQAMTKRHQLYNETVEYITQQQELGNVLIIRPPRDLKIGKMERNPQELKRVYEIGRKTTIDYLETIKTFLQEC